jgi:hypothetical protein
VRRDDSATLYDFSTYNGRYSDGLGIG